MGFLRKKKGYFLKLDFEKSYDKVGWSFLDEALKLKALDVDGESQSWVVCRRPTFSILIIDKPRGKIHAQKGLRLGNPLSSFFFTIIGMP